MERRASRLRHASRRSPKHRSGNWDSRRREDGLNDDNENIHQRGYRIRQRSRSLSPPRERYRKAFSKQYDLTELEKPEKPSGYYELKQVSRNEFRAERDDEMRRWPSRPLGNGDSDNLIRPSLEIRQSPINVNREVGNPNGLRRAHPERQCCPPSHGKEDVHRHHLLPGNTVIGTLPELFDHREDNDFRPAKRHDLDNHNNGMLLKKSIVLDDGSVQTFFTLPLNTSEPLHEPKSYFTHDILDSKTGVHYPIENVGFGSPDSVAAWYGKGPRYIETSNTHTFCYNSLSHEEVFDKEGIERNLSGSIMCPNHLPQSKSSVLDCEVSRLPRGFSFDGHTNSLHAWQQDFPNGNLYDASTSDYERHRDRYSKENASVDPIGSLSTKDLGLYSRRQMDGTKGSMAVSYTENRKRESSGTTLIPHERYNKRQHDPCHGCCVGSPPRKESWQVHETDWMQNTTNLENRLKVLEKDNVLQNYPVDDYINMRISSSLRAISSDLHAESFSSRSGVLSPISRMEISRDVPTRRDHEEYPFGKDVSIVKCRETARNSPLDGAVSLYRSILSPLSISRSPIRELDVHGSDIQGLKSNYIDDDDNPIHGLQFQEMDLSENQREYQVEMSRYDKRSKRSFHGKSSHRDSHSRLVSVNKSSDVQDYVPESKPQAKLSRSLEWTRSNWHDDDDYYFYEKEEQNFSHPHKFRKHEHEHNGQDRSWSRYHERDHLSDDRDPVKRPDLAEDSEAFKQQVQKAFLRFAKVLNENLAERKRYEAKGKLGSLLCIVCGRLSKDYIDTHSLVMHAFNSKKLGLRAEHLGLHKALCVLMSWSYSVVPGNAKVYQSLPASDARAMKEDLIVWPPLVIIHIPRFEKKEDGSQNAINNLEMDDILKGLGFSGGKSNTLGHRAGNQDTFMVKFFPTFSGLQVAERLHKYCKENHCGRDEWLQVQSLHRTQQDVGKDTNLLQVEGNAENRSIFYGYIGIAADLEEVDLDTKRRSLVKSRKDIAAITDVPVVIA